MLIKVIGVGLTTVFISLILKNVKPEISVLVNISGGILIACLVLSSVKDIIELCLGFADVSSIVKTMALPVLKIVGVGFLVEFIADSIDESGNKSLSNQIVFAGKIIILLMCIPAIKTLFELLFEIL